MLGEGAAGKSAAHNRAAKPAPICSASRGSVIPSPGAGEQHRVPKLELTHPRCSCLLLGAFDSRLVWKCLLRCHLAEDLPVNPSAWNLKEKACRNYRFWIIPCIIICFDIQKCSLLAAAITLLSLMFSFKCLFSLGFTCLVITVS